MSTIQLSSKLIRCKQTTDLFTAQLFEKDELFLISVYRTRQFISGAQIVTIPIKYL